MKYKLTNETIIHYGTTLYRIECIEAFSNVKVGDKGGFVETELNLSHVGNAWIYNDAKVYDYASVCGDAIVSDNAEVYDCAIISGNAKIFNNAKVYGNAHVFDDAHIYGNSEVYENTQVCGHAKVSDDARVFGNTFVCENAKVYGNAEVYGDAWVYEDALVYGDARVGGSTTICGDAKIESINDYTVFKNFWSSGQYFTWTRSNNMWKTGCFYGTGEELIKKSYEDSKLSGDCCKIIVDSVENIIKLTNNE